MGKQEKLLRYQRSEKHRRDPQQLPSLTPIMVQLMEEFRRQEEKN